MNYYKNKLVLITGGSSGMGFSMARQLAELEANVWILARRPEALQAATKEIEANRRNPAQRFGYIQADVTNEQEISSELERFMAEVGVPDIMVNAAGSSRPGMFLEQETEIFHQMMDLNYFGTVNVLKKIVPGMIKRRMGHIINFTSISGFVGWIGYSAYSGAKFAVKGFTDSIRPELKEYGIRVSLVYPPNTHTPGQEVENQYKPLITRVTEEDNTGTFEPDVVAKIIIKDASRGKYNILPGFSTKAWWAVYGMLGMPFNLVNTISDMLIQQGRRKIEKQNGKLKQSLEVSNERGNGKTEGKES